MEYDERRQRLLLTSTARGCRSRHLVSRKTARATPRPATARAAQLRPLCHAHRQRRFAPLSWNELRLFGPAGQFSSNGVYIQQLAGDTRGQQQGYILRHRYSNENENAALSWRAGDLITDALGWSNSVRLAACRSRVTSACDRIWSLIRCRPLAAAAVPSSVDLFINGYRSAQANVQPGPWSLTNVPFVNGAGDAVITTTDAVGRQVTTTLPFYVSSSLLKTGLSDYAFSAGAIRENYGIKTLITAQRRPAAPIATACATG